jgi:hypothetical protein
MLLIYNEKLIDLTLQEFNNIQQNPQFMIEEQKNNIYFLDITILKTANKLPYNIYRKPTMAGSNIQYIMPPHTTQNVSHQLSK